MPPGIRPTVYFALKKIFGSPQNSDALIGRLCVILDLGQPIRSVEIIHWFRYQQFSESKLVVLDVRCRDEAGCWLNAETQISVDAGLIQRLVYYARSLCVDQLASGGNYALATTPIAIRLLDRVLFTDTTQLRHRFQMLDRHSGRELVDAIEVHTVDLAKYEPSERSMGRRSKLDRWVFLPRHAQDYDGRMLRTLLPGIEFESAIARSHSRDAQVFWAC